MGWTLLEAKAQVHQMDEASYISQATWEAIAYLIAQAERYQDLRTALEDIVYKIQLRDSQHD